jgi:hypothetical protein
LAAGDQFDAAIQLKEIMAIIESNEKLVAALVLDELKDAVTFVLESLIGILRTKPMVTLGCGERRLLFAYYQVSLHPERICNARMESLLETSGPDGILKLLHLDRSHFIEALRLFALIKRLKVTPVLTAYEFSLPIPSEAFAMAKELEPVLKSLRFTMAMLQDVSPRDIVGSSISVEPVKLRLVKSGLAKMRL